SIRTTSSSPSPLGTDVPAGDDPARIELEQRVVGHAADEQAELTLALAQPLDSLPLGGDVAADAVDEAVGGGERRLNPAPRAVLVAEAVLHAHGGNALRQALGVGGRGVVRMAQLAHVHVPDLVRGPAEQGGPGRIDAGEVAVEGRDADQVLGDVPDAVALAGALGDLLFQPLRGVPQQALARGAFRGLDGGRQDAADAVGGGLVGDRAVAEGEAGILPPVAAPLEPPRVVAGEERVALAAQDRLVERPELVIDFRP